MKIKQKSKNIEKEQKEEREKPRKPTKKRRAPSFFFFAHLLGAISLIDVTLASNSPVNLKSRP
jgi:hypothetical protein